MIKKILLSTFFLGICFNAFAQNMKESTVLAGGNPIHIVGTLPKTGEMAPNFSLTDNSMKQKSLTDFKGKYVLLNIFPSVDTGVCSASVRHFNEDAAKLPNTAVLCISKDLPFAQKRFCGAEVIKNVPMLTDFRSDFRVK